MECKICGENISENDNYCSNCGSSTSGHLDEHELTTKTTGGYEMTTVYHKCENEDCSIHEKSKKKAEEKAYENSCPA